jgi:thiol-disulfide isomerase/thioredoxin
LKERRQYENEAKNCYYRCAFYLLVKELSVGSQATSLPKEAPPVAESIEPLPQPATSEVVVYYFHGTARCPTCRKFESYSDELIAEEFSEELNNGRLKWQVVNIDEPANKHFVTDYQLYSKSIVVVKNHPGKPAQWKNLDKIWERVRDKQAFVKYIKAEIEQYLRAD